MISGRRTGTAARSLGRRRGARTASSDLRAERRAGEAGADLFSTKPFSPLEILRLVDRIGEREPRC